jgi:hypothetical protein
LGIKARKGNIPLNGIIQILKINFKKKEPLILAALLKNS